MMNKHHYIISIGSNIDRDKNVKVALEILQQEQTLIGASKFYQTAPVRLSRPRRFFKWRGVRNKRSSA